MDTKPLRVGFLILFLISATRLDLGRNSQSQLWIIFFKLVVYSDRTE